jgi:hypothetical protein
MDFIINKIYFVGSQFSRICIYNHIDKGADII